MEETIYVDILIVINFIVDYFLLRLTAMLAGTHIHVRRLLLSAAVSSLTSLTIFLPSIPAWLSVLRNLIFSAGISMLAFGFQSVYAYFFRTVIFYAVNLIYAGGMLLLCWRTRPNGVLFLDGTLYFQMSPLFLIGVSSILYSGVRLFHLALGHGRVMIKSTRVLLSQNGIQFELKGFLDTGNHVSDIFTGLPVVFCTASALNKLTGSAGEEWFKSRSYLQGTEETPVSLRLRLIPFSGMGGESVLPAFTPDGLWIWEASRKQWQAVRAIVAVTPTSFRQGYDILLHPDLTQENTTGKDCPKGITESTDNLVTAKGGESL